jgi:peptide/nickel transport system ATP-binding protein
MPEASAATEGAPLVEVVDLVKHFDVSKPWLNRVLEGDERQLLKAVDGVSFAIPKGRTFGLVGESGCGKSTVARCAVGLFRPSGGRVMFGGRDIAGLSRRDSRSFRRRIQMIFQDPYASLNPRWRVREIIAEPIRAHRLQRERDAIRRRVDKLLTHVRLAPADGARYPHEFSGGQRQRISVARALASDPEFIVCDEPTSALDVSVQAQILNLMMELQAELGLTYLFISHNLAVVYHVADLIGVMYLGRIVEQGEARAVLTAPRHPYTRMLLDTLPDLGMTGREPRAVAGELPSPIAPPPGCTFHPRCPFARDRCRREEPRLLMTAGVQVACHGVEEGRIPILQRPTTCRF